MKQEKFLDKLLDKKLFIFDFDGTIADTVSTEFEIYSVVLARLGKKMKKSLWKKLLESHTAEGYLNLTNEIFDLSIKYDEFVDMYADAIRYVERKYPPILFGWVKPFLAQSPNVSKIILSNKDGNIIKENLASLGILNHFVDIFSCTTLHTTKEELYPQVLKKYQLSAVDCVLFEDTQRYIDAGKNIGFNTVGVIHKNNKKSGLLADFLIKAKVGE